MLSGDLYSNWTNIIISGGIAIILSWLGTGCRLGNQRVPQANANVELDPYTGFYAARPQSLTFYVTTHSNTVTTTASTQYIPKTIARVFSNPIALILQDQKAMQAVLVNPSTKTYLPIYIGQDLSLSLQASTPYSVYWSNPNCLSTVEITEKGRIIQFDSPPEIPGNVLPLRGNLQLNVQFIKQFAGDCTSTFQEIADCYQDFQRCGGNSDDENHAYQKALFSEFDPMIQSNALSVSDIPYLNNFAYEVSYE